jgi:hypothetical protein
MVLLETWQWRGEELRYCPKATFDLAEASDWLVSPGWMAGTEYGWVPKAGPDW